MAVPQALSNAMGPVPTRTTNVLPGAQRPLGPSVRGPTQKHRWEVGRCKEIFFTDDIFSTCYL